MTDLGSMTPSYPGVAELTRQLDQEKIAMLSKRVDDLRNQNQDLKNKIFKSEKDTHEFVAYFQKEMETKDAMISKLNDELIRKESEMRITVKQMQENAQREICEVVDQMSTSKKQFTAQIKLLEGDLSALVRFRELRDSHDKAMEEMAATAVAKEQRHVQEMSDLERKFLTDKGNLQKELERVIEDVKRQAKIEAHSSLGGETKRIAGDNKRMAKELRFQMQMTTELQAHSKALEDQVTIAAREVAILKEKDQEYARQGQAKAKELKHLRGQVAALTKALTKEAMKSKKEGEKNRHEVAREIEEQTLDVAGLRQLLALKNRELRNVRKLGQYILNQRSEVETFFLEALEEVKQNIVDGRHELYRRAVAEYNLRVREASRNKTIFPKLRDVTVLDPGPPSSLPTDLNTKVDIASLTWGDKERVLRLLFAKINNVQGCVQATPVHPLEAASTVDFTPSIDLAGDDHEVQQGDQTFVTQADGSRRGVGGSGLELMSGREIGEGGQER